MVRLNICIDIDGTITDPFYWLDLANYYFNKNLKEDDVKEYEIYKVLGVSEEEYNKFYDMYSELIHFRAKPREFASKVLKDISQKHNIYYVSAREPKLMNITEKWLKRYNFPKGEVYLLGTHNKIQKAKELRCDIFIEDRYENAVQLAKEGFKVLLIDCPYNRKPLKEGIYRVFNWEQIHEIIELIEKEKEIA
ncbi:5' nucleotidase, NT5C type [Caloramator australicus]|uniref:Nucleotidase n=1 Tax=Caloramator australicus RC3 TaxID=857293 RepID=G0V3L1_9CLOT|nr:hypothetical protein [Caloramator australicus]CCC57701.1 HAD-superfamily hydrolase-like protein [Caloramator australicus RC3]